MNRARGAKMAPILRRYATRNKTLRPKPTPGSWHPPKTIDTRASKVSSNVLRQIERRLSSARPRTRVQAHGSQGHRSALPERARVSFGTSKLPSPMSHGSAQDQLNGPARASLVADGTGPARRLGDRHPFPVVESRPGSAGAGPDAVALGVVFAGFLGPAHSCQPSSVSRLPARRQVRTR